MPRIAKYSKYNLLSVARRGDIVYEEAGGKGITGHIVIVEGKYYSASKKQFFLRVVEAGKPNGTGKVARGVLDDNRIDDRVGHVLRVKNANNTQINNAVDFCLSQLDKGYKCDLRKDYSINQENWYCSELVWAAYYRQGINIETTGTVDEPGITPRDIWRSSKINRLKTDGIRTENKIIDISSHWAKDYIKYAVSNGLMNGTSASTFAPDTKTTRAMLVTVLYWMENRPTVGKNPYTDVKANQWYTNAVIWASKAGITNGTSNTTFSPSQTITREQAALMLYTYASSKKWNTTASASSLNTFSDRSKVSSYATTAMRWAVTHKIMSGTNSTTLSPQGTLTRAQLATILKRLVENTAK